MTFHRDKINLKQEWSSDMTALGAETTLATAVRDKIFTHYSEPHRHYHGLGHLGALFGLLAQHAPQAVGSAARLAVWWHDVIYDPMSAENEVKSADMARADLINLGADPTLVLRVVDIIVATKNHFTAPSFGNDDAFMDADIAILGAPTPLYHRYVEQVRAEYSVVPPALFNAGRVKFLKYAVSKTPLFKTTLFETIYGDQARANMVREINQLEAGIL
jgi:predicted metal-dependent HD superfamily phosphohydrolase